MAISLLLLAGAAFGATGIFTGVDGTMKITDAKKAIKLADTVYNTKKNEFDLQKRRTLNELERLGMYQQEAQASFFRFADAFEKIQNRPVFENVTNDAIELEDISLDNIKMISIKALDVLGGTALSVVAGAATGAAAYGGVMTFGFASTGAAISGLHGAAATNATLAALGGGAKVVGGGGMALGKVVLAGTVAGPVMAVTGLLMQIKGNESVEKAQEAVEKVEEALQLMNQSTGYVNRLRHLSMILRDRTEKLYELYMIRISKLEELVSREINYMNYTEEERQLVDNNILVIKYLAHLTRLALIEVNDEQEEVVRTEAVKKEIALTKSQRSLAS